MIEAEELSPKNPEDSPPQGQKPAPSPGPASDLVPEFSLSNAARAKRRKKRIRTIRNSVIAACSLFAFAALMFLSWKFLFGPDSEGLILTDFATLRTIQSIVEGGGTTKAKESATITPAAGGIVRNLYVTEGQLVSAGTLLYHIDSEEAAEFAAAARKNVTTAQKELDKIHKAYQELVVRAPHSGKLLNVLNFQLQDAVGSGTKIATLVDDTLFRLTLYYSYLYEHDIVAGQEAEIIIPATMGTYRGTVEHVNFVRRVSPEGAILFEVVFTLQNPGALDKDMEASAALINSSGDPVYPYESGKLAYYQSTDIITKAGGPVEKINLRNDFDVKSGDVLLVMGAENHDEQVAAKEKELKLLLEKLEDAQKALDNLNAVSPIDGTILSCTLIEGEKAEAGMGINIANTTTMMVSAQIDERNVSFVKPGMVVNIDQWGNIYSGIVETVSLEGRYEGGISVFPATIRVDNPDRNLMSGMYVTYSFVASQSDGCIAIPLQCVQYVDLGEKETGAVVFLRSHTRPEHALDLGKGAELPAGFFAVPVEVGLSDTYYVEIIEGLSEGDEVFTSVMMAQEDSYW